MPKENQAAKMNIFLVNVTGHIHYGYMYNITQPAKSHKCSLHQECFLALTQIPPLFFTKIGHLCIYIVFVDIQV